VTSVTGTTWPRPVRPCPLAWPHGAVVRHWDCWKQSADVDVLVTVKAYPEPSQRHGEVVCVAVIRTRREALLHDEGGRARHGAGTRHRTAHHRGPPPRHDRGAPGHHWHDRARTDAAIATNALSPWFGSASVPPTRRLLADILSWIGSRSTRDVWWWLDGSADDCITSQGTTVTGSIRFGSAVPSLPAIGVTIDDGIDADTERGSGLRGLADRLEVIGGQLRVWRPAGGGTRVEAELPCG
jgi:hypothetical protein